MRQDHLFLEELYTAYAKDLERMCRRKVGYDPTFYDLIDETIQEVFLLAYEHYSTLKNHPNIGGWLMQTCNHRLLPYVKQQRSRNKYHEFSLDHPDAPLIATKEDIAGTVVETIENRAMIDNLFALLTEKEQTTFQAFFLEKQSIAQIAAKEKTSENSIKALIYRIRQKAKKSRKTFFFFSVTLFCFFYYTL